MQRQPAERARTSGAPDSQTTPSRRIRSGGRSTNTDRILTRGFAIAGIGALFVGALAVIGLCALAAGPFQ